jgi:flavin-dependent dehydrogenase
MYVTPVGPEDVCVVLITADKQLRLEEALPRFPEVWEHLSGHTPCDRPTGGLTVTRKLRAVATGRIALLGDSSGSADAITGDGLSLAFQQATALVDAICAAELSGYQGKHDAISRLPRNMGELMLLMDDYPWLRRRVFRAFAESPRMFEKLLGIHTRTISPLHLGLKDCLAFGLSLLRA